MSKGLKMSKGMNVKLPKGMTTKKLRKGTDPQDINTMETPESNPMSDYARMMAAGGGQ
jgi:hypothetical protein